MITYRGHETALFRYLNAEYVELPGIVDNVYGLSRTVCRESP